MKLLLNENLSDRIAAKIVDLFPGSSHVKPEGLIHADDARIWEFARINRFTLVSKDADFHQRSLLFGHPPRLVFLRTGNCSTETVVELLRRNAILISEFHQDAEAAILILPPTLSSAPE